MCQINVPQRLMKYIPIDLDRGKANPLPQRQFYLLLRFDHGRRELYQQQSAFIIENATASGHSLGILLNDKGKLPKKGLCRFSGLPGSLAGRLSGLAFGGDSIPGVLEPKPGIGSRPAGADSVPSDGSIGLFGAVGEVRGTVGNPCSNSNRSASSSAFSRS
jgi:hypothetical protein